MSYITLTYSPPPAFGFPYAAGTEKTLYDWGITSCSRDVQNMAQDNLGFNISYPATSGPIFAYLGRITLQLGRIGGSFVNGTPTTFTGGVPWSVHYILQEFRNASGRMQRYQYKAASVWETFMERHVFQKFGMQWNGLQGAASGLVMAPRSQIWLGQSIATLTEPNGQQTTEMTVAQQVAEIVNFTIAQTIAEYSGGPLGNPMPITIPLNAGTNCDVVIANYIKANAPSALFALDTMFATDANFNVVGTAGQVTPLNGNSDPLEGWLGLCPMDAANDLTCAEALRKTLKVLPSVTMWFDFSPTIGAAATSSVPVLHIATRDTLPPVTLPWGNSSPTQPYGHRTSKIDMRNDLVPSCVDYKYKVTTTVNGVQNVTIYDDIGCAVGYTSSTGTLADPGQPIAFLNGVSTPYFTAVNTLLPQTERFRAEVATFDFNGGSSTSTTLTCLAIPFGDVQPSAPVPLNSLWRTVLVTSFNDPSITNLTGSAVPNVQLTLTDGVTLADSAYKWFIVGGPIASGWRDTANPGLPQGVQMKLAATFSYTESVTLASGTSQQVQQPVSNPSVRKSVDIYAFTAQSGTLGTITSFGEPVPFGLAKYVYNIESVTQFDGSHGIVEVDPDTKLPTITDACPVGKSLNLAIPTSDPNYATALAAGTVALYASMNAQVQTCSYDLMTGHTDITFGVAKHLGGSEMIERLRINRGPRWLYEIGPTLNNSLTSGASVSGTTQLKDTQRAVSSSNYSWMPQGLSDGTGVTPTTGGNQVVPGITCDTRTTGQPDYGLGVLNTPTIHIQGGTGGTLSNWINMNVATAQAVIHHNPTTVDPGPTIGPTAGGIGFVAYAGLSTNSTPGWSMLNSRGLVIYAPAVTGTSPIPLAQVQLLESDLAGLAGYFAGIIRFREYACCYDFGDGNGPVAAFVILPGSIPYKTSLGTPLAGPWTS